MLRYQGLRLSQLDRVALDTETTGLNWPVAKMFGYSLTCELGSFYADIRHDPMALEWLINEISTFGGTLIFFNASFDAKMLISAGVPINPEQCDDTAIRACLIDEHRATPFPWDKRSKHRGYSLDSLAKDCLGAQKTEEIYQELADLFGGQATRNVQMANLHKAPPEIVAPYAIRDTELTWRLWHWQEAEINTPDRFGMDLRKIAAFERSVFPHVLDQETQGIRVDVDAAVKAQTSLHIEIDRQKEALNTLLGKTFNVNSTPQIREYYQPKEIEDKVWALPDGTPCNTTDKGGPSINNEVLQKLAGAGDRVAQSIIDIRSLIRTADTFLGKHVLGHQVNGRVYPNINQVASDDGGTKTGRFSYVDPALQQIPNRNKVIASIVKPVFLPDEGHVWVDGDLQSFEVRTFAHLVARFNDALVRIYQENPDTDFHQWVADLMGVPRDPQPSGGANAKQLNLSMIFNQGKGATAHKLGLPTTPDSFDDAWGQTIRFHKSGIEGDQVIAKYHSRVKGVRELVDAAKAKVNQRGYIFTQYGRKLRFPRNYKDYKASGILIQATAADINKENWIIVNDALGDRGRLMLNTHDSYSMSVEEGREHEAWKDVKAAIERPVMRVPLILDLNGMGSNWWDAIRKDK